VQGLKLLLAQPQAALLCLVDELARQQRPVLRERERLVQEAEGVHPPPTSSLATRRKARPTDAERLTRGTKNRSRSSSRSRTQADGEHRKFSRRIVGRADLKSERRDGSFVVKALHLDPGVCRSTGARAPNRLQLQAFCKHRASVAMSPCSA
jgi:hypothetical protein